MTGLTTPWPLDVATIRLYKAGKHLKEARKRLERHPCYEHRMELTAAESAYEAAIEYRRDIRESFAEQGQRSLTA